MHNAVTHDLSLGQHQAVEYDKVITNVGNAYDSRHGHFIDIGDNLIIFYCLMLAQ
jgi:hypothetical protein